MEGGRGGEDGLRSALRGSGPGCVATGQEYCRCTLTMVLYGFRGKSEACSIEWGVDSGQIVVWVHCDVTIRFSITSSEFRGGLGKKPAIIDNRV